MRGRNSFHIGAVQHIYQRTHNGFLVFYSVRDYLVFFTILCVAARRYKVIILGICFMVDHIHILAVVNNKEQLQEFVRFYTTEFSKAYNSWHIVNGSLFRGPFGFASKVTGKDIRSAIAYLYNNPVEKQVCRRPEQSQWNFLAYGVSKNPFSDPLRVAQSSAWLRSALKEVSFQVSNSRPLSYAQLHRLSLSLTRTEQKQLADYIIRSYNCIDYAAVSDYFGGYEKMIIAINTTKGSEYDIPEDFTAGSDLIYSKMTQFLLDTGVVDSVDLLLHLPEDIRRSLIAPLCTATGASIKKAAKYLHVKIV